MSKMVTGSVALISRIFAQASAEPNLFELCRAQPKISKQIFAQARAIFVQASAAENVKK